MLSMYEIFRLKMIQVIVCINIKCFERKLKFLWIRKIYYVSYSSHATCNYVTLQDKQKWKKKNQLENKKPKEQI